MCEVKVKNKLICIKCPLGCPIHVERSEKTILLSGNKCKIGESYAIKEIRNPMRILTTTVFIKGGTRCLLPVRSEEDIPKHLIRKCIKELSSITIKAPIKCNDIIY